MKPKISRRKALEIQRKEVQYLKDNSPEMDSRERFDFAWGMVQGQYQIVSDEEAEAIQKAEGRDTEQKAYERLKTTIDKFEEKYGAENKVRSHLGQSPVSFYETEYFTDDYLNDMVAANIDLKTLKDSISNSIGPAGTDIRKIELLRNVKSRIEGLENRLEHEERAEREFNPILENFQRSLNDLGEIPSPVVTGEGGLSINSGFNGYMGKLKDIKERFREDWKKVKLDGTDAIREEFKNFNELLNSEDPYTAYKNSIEPEPTPGPTRAEKEMARQTEINETAEAFRQSV